MTSVISRQLISLTRRYSSKVPDKPTWIPIDNSKLPEVPELTTDVIDHLERVSLVEFNNQAGVDRLKVVIESANKLLVVNTEGVEPLDSVLEKRPLYLREDKITDGKRHKEITGNATQTFERFFVAPQGNVPMKKKQRDYKENNIETES